MSNQTTAIMRGSKREHLKRNNAITKSGASYQILTVESTRDPQETTRTMKQNQQLNVETTTKSTRQTHKHLDLEATEPQPWQIARGKGERQEDNQGSRESKRKIRLRQRGISETP